MLLYVSSGGEPGPVGGGQSRVGAFAAFEFAQPGGFCTDAHRGLDQGGSSLVPEVSKILGRGHGSGVDDEVECFPSDRTFDPSMFAVKP